MHAGRVQRFCSAGDPQEAGALFEGLRPKPGHLQQVRTAGKRSVGVAVGHNVFAQQRPDAGNPAQQGGRGSVHVHPNGVDAVLHHGVQGPVQLRRS